MCDHSDDKQHVYLQIIDHPDFEVYVCECGALTNINDPKNYKGDPCHAMTATEIESMLVLGTPITDMARLQEIADLKWEIFKEDGGIGLLMRDDEVALEYQRLTREAQRIQRKWIGPNWWGL